MDTEEEIYDLIKQAVISDIKESRESGYDLNSDQEELRLIYNITEEELEIE
jgi:hypothetical protein